MYRAFLHNVTVHSNDEKTADEAICSVAAVLQTEHGDFLRKFCNFLKILSAFVVVISKVKVHIISLLPINQKN
jgi:hypothetical protein